MASDDSRTVTAVPDALLNRIRKEVRGASVYKVGGFEGCNVKLNQNESPYDLPISLKRELAELLLATPLNRYPAEQPDRLRRALGDALGHDPDGILVGNGSNEISYTFGLALVDAGTPVVLPRPMFSLYRKVARLHGADLVEIPPREDLTFDAGALAEAVEEHDPPLVVLTTPNNPTGRVMTNAEVEAILARSRGIVVVDEAYIEFSDEPTVQPMLARYPNLIVMRTFSKACGLAGIRLGFLMGRPEIITELQKSRIPFVVDPLAEEAGLLLLRHMDVITERVRIIKQERDKLFQALRAMDGVETVPTQTNFFIFRARIQPADLLAMLAKRDVLVRDVSSYPDLRGYCRVSAGLPDENQRFLIALNDALMEADRNTGAGSQH